MKVKTCDLVEVATDDVLRWFEACETKGDCTELARDMKDMIGSIAATTAERLSHPDASRPDPDRVRPTEDGLGLSFVPFTVRHDPHDPLYTFDCAWSCGTDVLRARSKRAVGRTTLPFSDFPRQLKVEVEATVYKIDEEAPEGFRLHGHVAVADYHGGWLVWLADDLACEHIPECDVRRHTKDV